MITMKKAIAITFAVIGGIVVLLVGIGLAAGPQPASHPAAQHTPTSSPAARHTTTAPAVATPHPSGKYSGSCDYTLSSNIYGDDHLIGEVDLTNTGNIGTDVHVRITWPQEGYAPVVKTRNVKTNPGQHLAVRFHVPVPSSGNVITQLQSWMEHHNFKPGCTYKATITGTFGSAS